MSDIEVGQVLSLKIQYNNTGLRSENKHPYLVVGIDEHMGVVEIAQLDSLEGKRHKAAMKCNKTIFRDEPMETVIDKDSYIQLDNTFLIEDFDGLSRFRRQRDKLSSRKLQDVVFVYREYHEKNQIDENKIVYMSQELILELNP